MEKKNSPMDLFVDIKSKKKKKYYQEKKIYCCT